MKKTVANLISGFVLHVIVIASGFVLPRLIILYYGSTINGVIGSIGQAIAYVALVEMGIGNVAISKLYKPIASDKIEEISAIVSETRRKYLKAGAIYSVLVLILSMVYPLAIRGQIEYRLTVILFIIIGLKGMAQG